MGYAIFKWLQIRLGVETVKPDVHVMNFVKDCIGRVPRNEETVRAIERVAQKIGIRASRLDFAIWGYQRDKSIRKRREQTRGKKQVNVPFPLSFPVLHDEIVIFAVHMQIPHVQICNFAYP